MELSEFLTKVEHLSESSGLSVVAFQGEDAPSLFLSRFFARAQGSFFSTASLHADTTSLQDAQAALDVSFLGKRLVYWLKGFDELSSSVKKNWTSYIKTYEGPHCIVLYDEAKSFTASQSCTLVSIPASIPPALYKQLGQFLYPTIQFDPYFTQMLFQQSGELSLDKACMMLEYHTVVGRKCEEFFKDWYGKLVVGETSLFTMAQYFLAKQPKPFFEQWNKCNEDYPHEFWVAYWSELFWQASLFVMRARSKGHAEAKKAAYRLPFSFINKDWQRYSADSFIEAHRVLYEFEYGVKQGERSWGLELFFHRFFL